jgi:hypothetical protein
MILKSGRPWRERESGHPRKNNWDIHENAQTFIVKSGSQSNSEAIPREIGKLSRELKDRINDEK